MGFKAYNNNPKLSCHDTSVSIPKLIPYLRKNSLTNGQF